MPDQLNHGPYERTSIRLDQGSLFLDKTRWLSDWILRARLANVDCYRMTPPNGLEALA